MGMNPMPETIKKGRLLIGFRIFMAVDPIPRIPNLEKGQCLDDIYGKVVLA